MTPAGAAARETAERSARESYGRLVAFLAARSGDVAAAEDALAEAFAAALEAWTCDGPPANPDAWLLTVARRRQADAVRKAATGRMGEGRLVLMAQDLEAAAMAPDEIPDRRLALMFACAHPAIEPALRAPLILQALLGLTAADIAQAFLVPPATMGQRLVRAKARIKASGAPLVVPQAEDLPGRVDAVLEAVYAAYAKSWNDSGEAEPTDLTGEAIWLGRLVVSLLPQEPEAKGMLALMLYAEARRPARRSAAGDYVPLEDQETALWDRGLLGAAETLLHRANAAGPSGRYQVEAAIQSAHVARRLTGQPGWDTIVALYDHLAVIAPSPVVRLNRAVALARAEGPAAALAEIEALAADKRMADYQPYWAARGRICAELGRRTEAYEALTLAIGLSSDQAVRRYLQRGLEALRSG